MSVWLDTVGWPAGYFRCQLCPGPLESTKIYAAYSNNLGVKLDRLDCGVLSFDGVTNLQTWAAAAFDATWTHADISGICYDATDDTLIMVVLGNGTVINKLVKVDKNPGSSIIWTADIPNNFGAELGVGSCFQFCDIQNGRLGLFTNSPAKVTIYDTSDGSVVSQYTTGLAGINQIGYQGGQCYNDTLGAICLPMGFTQTTGSPSLLNSTPASFSGWSLLYAGNAVVVSSGDPDGWFQVMKPVTPLS